MILLESTTSVVSQLPLLISIISLLVSLLSTYFSTFKKSRPGVLISSQLEIYNAPMMTAEGTLWGGVGVYIPMTFFNWSPNGGSIVECRISIARLDNPNEIFDFSWTEFQAMLQTERRMGYEGFAQPIPLSPNSSLSKTVLFVWYPGEKNLAILNGRYKLDVLFWTGQSAPPNIKQSFEFSITEKQAQDFNFYLKNKNSSTVSITIREISRTNSVLTKEQASKIYG